MLRHSFETILGIVFTLFISITSLPFFILALFIWICSYPFDKRLVLLHQFTCFWSGFYLCLFPLWKIQHHGRDQIDPNQTYIYVSNHQSLVDIVAAFTLFSHFKWVSKGELFSIPFIGWNMYLNHYVRLKRGKKSNTRRLYRACERHLKEGSSVFIFPEGNRSKTEHPRAFREGAFVLAKRLNLPILPIAISGSRGALSGLPKPADIHLKILPPVMPLDNVSSQEMAIMVRQKIIKAIDS
ncbi:MAG: 1-acyl-sn-glycerol-3-phosphate acyltransferase [Pseudomonadales bacterium]|nr:1-acyl-sn-glycerol-3-phosphate acyltransferase [Pseudomonadales bacterium]